MTQQIGLPVINVEFQKKASTVVKRGSNGVIAMVLKDTTNQGVFYVTGNYDIPGNLNASNKKYLKLALVGNVNKPSKIVCACIGAEGDINDGLALLETEEFNYLVVPSQSGGDTAKIKTFVEKMRNDIKYNVKAVLPQTADAEYIINADTENIDFEGESGKLNKNEFSILVASTIVGTPLSQSITYVSPRGITNIPAITRANAETAVKAGKLILIKEMGKIRFARGVTSLTTTTSKSEEFKKIKVMDILDLIHNDIRQICVESYIGKMPNSYDNKCKLLVGLNSYFEVLAKEELIEKNYTVEIDLDAQKLYLKELGLDVSSMPEQEIKEANTRDKVFIKASVTPLDAMEEIKVKVEV